MSNFARQVPSLKAGLASQVIEFQFPYGKGTGIEADWENLGSLRFQDINQLETVVSVIQTATVNLQKIREWMFEMQHFLEPFQLDKKRERETIDQKTNLFLKEKVSKITTTARNTKFNGHSLFDSPMGFVLRFRGNRLCFERESSEMLVYSDPAEIVDWYKVRNRPVIIGPDALTPENLKRESEIALYEKSHEVHYHFQGNEDPETLVSNLQHLIVLQGMDLCVFRSEDNHLMIVQNRLSAENQFRGISNNTRLISPVPGHPAHPGVIRGMVPSHKQASFAEGNREPEVVYFPSLLPEYQSQGIPNSSGFTSLSEIKGNTTGQCQDALTLVNWGLEDLDVLRDYLQQKEEQYVDQTMEMLRGSVFPPSPPSSPDFSREKASQMAEQLRDLLKNS